MMFSNASDGRRAAWTGAAGIVLGAMLVGGVALARLHHRAAERRVAAALDDLTPDPAALHYRAAIELAHQYKGRSAAAPNILATAHLALGELAEAGDAAQAALAIKPDTSGYLMRALVMQAQGRDAEAALDFTRAARAEEPGDLQ